MNPETSYVVAFGGIEMTCECGHEYNEHMPCPKPLTETKCIHYFHHEHQQEMCKCEAFVEESK